MSRNEIFARDLIASGGIWRKCATSLQKRIQLGLLPSAASQCLQPNHAHLENNACLIERPDNFLDKDAPADLQKQQALGIL